VSLHNISFPISKSFAWQRDLHLLKVPKRLPCHLLFLCQTRQKDWTLDCSSKPKKLGKKFALAAIWKKLKNGMFLCKICNKPYRLLHKQNNHNKQSYKGFFKILKWDLERSNDFLADKMNRGGWQIEERSMTAFVRHCKRTELKRNVDITESDTTKLCSFLGHAPPSFWQPHALPFQRQPFGHRTHVRSNCTKKRKGLCRRTFAYGKVLNVVPPWLGQDAQWPKGWRQK